MKAFDLDSMIPSYYGLSENGKAVHQETYLKYTNDIRKIDDLTGDLSQANLLLIDIEGMDIDALNGAKELIRRSGDLKIIFEYSEDGREVEKDSRCFDFLESLDYRFYVIKSSGIDEILGPDLVPVSKERLLFDSVGHMDVFAERSRR